MESSDNECLPFFHPSLISLTELINSLIVRHKLDRLFLVENVRTLCNYFLQKIKFHPRGHQSLATPDTYPGQKANLRFPGDTLKLRKKVSNFCRRREKEERAEPMKLREYREHSMPLFSTRRVNPGRRIILNDKNI